MSNGTQFKVEAEVCRTHHSFFGHDLTWSSQLSGILGQRARAPNSSRLRGFRGDRHLARPEGGREDRIAGTIPAGASVQEIHGLHVEGLPKLQESGTESQGHKQGCCMNLLTARASYSNVPVIACKFNIGVDSIVALETQRSSRDLILTVSKAVHSYEPTAQKGVNNSMNIGEKENSVVTFPLGDGSMIKKQRIRDRLHQLADQ